MSSDPESQLFRSVTEGEVTVTKSYAPEEFPVPAIKFVVESTADERVDVRLVDSIPPEFPMENVGFHPDFEKDNWTAYKSHQVEYDRSLDAGESVTTVYGIRLDETEPAAFMTDPEVELLGDDLDSADQTLDDVLGDDSNQVVRDVLSGERESLPGLEPDAEGDVTVDAPSVDTGPETTVDAADDGEGANEPEGLELDLEAADDAVSDAPQPAAFDSSGRSATDLPASAAVTEHDGTESAPDDRDEEDEDGDDVAEDIVLDVEETEPEDAHTGAGEARAADVTEETVEDDAVPVKEAESGESRRTAGGILAALTDELARDDVADEDVEALREALGVDDDTSQDATVPRSVELRIQRLQNKVEDLSAYSAGLEAFLDEEGTAEELIDGFRDEVEATNETVEALSDRADRAADDRAALREDVGGLGTDVSDLDDRMASVDTRLDGVDDRLEGLDECVAAVEDRLDAVDETVAAVDSQLDALDSRFDAVDDRLEEVNERLETVDDRAAHAEERAEGLDEEMGEVREELATLDGDIREAREQLTDEVDELRVELDEQVAATLDEQTEAVDAVRDDVAGLQSEVESLDDTVEDFRAFRTRLSSALGPLAGGAAADEDADAGVDADADADGDADADIDGEDADTDGEGDDADVDVDDDADGEGDHTEE